MKQLSFKIFYVVMILFLILIYSVKCQLCVPFGVRLNYGSYFTQQKATQKIGIRFDTHQNCNRSYITVQKSGRFIRKIYCDTIKLSFQSYTSYVHKCSISDISEGETIKYMVVGWTGNISDPQIPYKNQPIQYRYPNFKQDFKIIVVADWGYLRQMRTVYKPLDNSFQYLLKNDESINGIFINGDVAYDLQSNNGQNYEDFLNMISQVTIKWPIIINPGNHQHRDNNLYVYSMSFQTYGMADKRVAMLRLPMYNFIMFDPYQILYNKQPQQNSFAAYKNVLQNAYLWKQLTILASHYPFRCNGPASDCIVKHEAINKFYSAMFQTNVPLYLGAHFHAYQRHYPFKSDNTYIRQLSEYEWSYDMSAQNRKLVSVVEGIAGNDAGIVQDYDQLYEWTASYSYNKTGYGMLKVGQNLLTYAHFTTNDANTPTDYFQMALKRLRRTNLRFNTI